MIDPTSKYSVALGRTALFDEYRTVRYSDVSNIARERDPVNNGPTGHGAPSLALLTTVL